MLGEREAADLQRAQTYLTAQHRIEGGDERLVVEFGEPVTITFCQCSCGYRSLGFRDPDTAFAAVARHVARENQR